jgi:PAT family beta-lactamase induction signal transducer AmpG
MSAPTSSTITPRPWAWIPSLYFSQGIPYVVAMTLSVVMYKNLGVSNTDIALYTSWLYLPWIFKPLWSPVVEIFRTKRFWIVALQFVIGAALASVAFVLPGPAYFKVTLGVFFLMAFSSATHDIAADGFYMLALDQEKQAAFVGVRSTFYRLAMIAGQGGLVFLAGWLAGAATLPDWFPGWCNRIPAWLLGLLPATFSPVIAAWILVFGFLSALFLVAGLYHSFALPRPANDGATAGGRGALDEFFAVFFEFFRKPGILTTLAFLLLYRFAESQALKLVSPFLLDSRNVGGLGLTTPQLGFVYGTVGVVALTLGGLVGGWMISRLGLKRMLWPMILSMNLPNLVFVYLAMAQPVNLGIISSALALEQFGYGFGFTAYMLYMIMVSEGRHRTAHYAICTGFMALGMMLPGMGAGWLQDHLGYQRFFLWVMLCTLPSFIATAFLKVDPGFGKKAA